MARRRLAIGEHGEIYVAAHPEGRWMARVQVRDADGRLRQVKAIGDSKSAAKRALTRRLQERGDPGVRGVHRDMTIDELATYWLAHRAAHGKSRGKGPLAPQTLSAYNNAINDLIRPALGSVRVGEVKVGLLDTTFARIESGADRATLDKLANGRSTAQARTALKQMLDLAVRHGALQGNPMGIVEPTSIAPRGGKDVQYLTVPLVLHLRASVRRQTLRIPDQRMPNVDLEEWVDFLLATGCRDGEALATRWCDLDLTANAPTLKVCGTLLEPRTGYVEKLCRQDATKSRSERTLILPDWIVAVVRARQDRSQFTAPEDPVFATGNGTWVSPANLRTRLRKAIGTDPSLTGTTPHTLRRSVGTLIAHEVGLDAAREQLGHSDPSVTFQHYVGRRTVGPDLRDVLDAFFAPLPPLSSLR